MGGAFERKFFQSNKVGADSGAGPQEEKVRTLTNMWKRIKKRFIGKQTHVVSCSCPNGSCSCGGCYSYFSAAWENIRTRYNWSPRLEFPPWRWATNFEWLSQTNYEGRVVVIQNKKRKKVLEDQNLERKQTKFKPNRFKSAKYTILTFPIVNLFEQFRRAANFYFLVSLILTLTIDSPISPISWLFSLMFVVLVTMIKQGYEDYLRHVDDRKNNDREVKIVHNGEEISIKSQDVQVGDILVLRNNDPVPCDVVLLSTSHPKDQCFIETSHLDGETSLKTKMAPNLTKTAKSLEQVSSLYGRVECENPNPKLDSFLGRISIWTDEDETKQDGPLKIDNVLLAGTVLKNTKKVMALCLYTGTETKISLNSKITKNKFSTIENSLNRYLMFLVAVLVSQIISATILSFAFDYEFHKSADLYLSSLGKVLNFFGADKDIYLNITNINRPEHRRNIQTLLGYKGNPDYPRTDYVQNERAWYLDEAKDINFVRILEVCLLWMVTFNYIIPLSLYVSLELQKFVASVQFTWDKHLYDEEIQEPAQCHTSDINEELGLVTHLLTDKTGTITKNEMKLKKLCVDGETVDADMRFPKEWNYFTMVLCLCHSVQVSDDEQFVASSPDELAILETCRANGFLFCGEVNGAQDGEEQEHEDRVMEVQVNGSLIHLTKLEELAFDSVRKCMTVIVKDEKDGTIHVLTKGAENVMLSGSQPACDSGDIDATLAEIDSYADIGLRTLALGHKTITEDQLENFRSMLKNAHMSLVNRDKFVRDAYREIEQGLTCLGATGIEDKLQDEVVETICDLKKAGIKIWMLTGDKKETATNLGHSAGILSPNSELIDLCDKEHPKDVPTLLSEIVNKLDTSHYFHRKMVNRDAERLPDVTERTTRNSVVSTLDRRLGGPISLIIDGKAISDLYKSQESVKHLEKLSNRCETVIACRLSPIQKSQLVRLVKDASDSNVTAAIGDGGNDVSMLQEAHVGLGIIGKEGREAAQASDFAFSKFKCLKRTLLVHGHWFYNRASFLVQYSFYKNIAFCTGQFYFMFFSNFSAQTLFESNFLFLFNTAYTLVPVIIYGILEQQWSAKTLESEPELYRENALNSKMSFFASARWLMLAVWHSFVAFFGWYFLYQEATTASTDIYYFQSAVSQTSVIIVNLKLLMESRYWTWPVVISVIVSISMFYLLTLLYHSIGPLNIFLLDNYDYYFTYTTALSDPLFWACTLLSVFTALLPDLILTVDYRPDIVIRRLRQKQERQNVKRNQTLPYSQTTL